MVAKTILISGICLLFVSGCASMSKSECASANWEARGSLDGQNGSSLSLLSSHAKACGKIGVSPDAELGRKGHANGVRLYCTPRNGLAEGRQNAQYNDVCPTDLEAPFLSSFVDGLELSLYRVEREKASAESKLYRLRIEQAAHDGPAPDTLVRRLEKQENAVSNYSSEELRLKLRISELRLKINSNR